MYQAIDHAFDNLTIITCKNNQFHREYPVVAVLLGRFNATVSLLEYNASVLAVDNFGFTPLHVATSNPEFYIIQLLLDQPGIDLIA